MADLNNTPDRRPRFKVSVEFDGMTWGDLRAFVQMGAAYPADSEVGQTWHEDPTTEWMYLIGLEELMTPEQMAGGAADGT